MTDANGQLVAHAHQNPRSWKEDVLICADEQETQPLWRLKGKDLFGFTYSIESIEGRRLGAVRVTTVGGFTAGSYDIVDEHDASLARVHAADAWVSAAERFLGDIPILDYIVFALLKPT